MGREILLSTSYCAPVSYFALIASSDKIAIEYHENYIKQTYRNRCYIPGANGVMMLTVPVKEGSFHKVPVSELEIDYSGRWRKVHKGAIVSAYRNSPYFEFYQDDIMRIIERRHELLIHLNSELLKTIADLIDISVEIGFTESFEKPGIAVNDFRYSLTPKKAGQNPVKVNPWQQVFSSDHASLPGISIIDLLFNIGPDTKKFLESCEVDR